ncbi:hypothetical protein D3C81_1914590 [compost metagenome]
MLRNAGTVPLKSNMAVDIQSCGANSCGCPRPKGYTIPSACAADDFIYTAKLYEPSNTSGYLNVGKYQ